MFKKLSKKKGFTLMEMMIVVAIIAILMAIIIPTFTNAMNNAKAATDEANLRAYYAETMATCILEDRDPKDAELITGSQATITVAGVDYKLYGSVKMEKGNNHQIKITYTEPGTNGKEVIIPGGGNTGATTGG